MLRLTPQWASGCCSSCRPFVQGKAKGTTRVPSGRTSNYVGRNDLRVRAGPATGYGWDAAYKAIGRVVRERLSLPGRAKELRALRRRGPQALSVLALVSIAAGRDPTSRALPLNTAMAAGALLRSDANGLALADSLLGALGASFGELQGTDPERLGYGLVSLSSMGFDVDSADVRRIRPVGAVEMFCAIRDNAADERVGGREDFSESFRLAAADLLLAIAHSGFPDARSLADKLLQSWPREESRADIEAKKVRALETWRAYQAR